jgi:hypothetical protein
MDGPAPRYIVFDDAPQIKGLGCTADALAAALRGPCFPFLLHRGDDFAFQNPRNGTRIASRPVEPREGLVSRSSRIIALSKRIMELNAGNGIVGARLSEFVMTRLASKASTSGRGLLTFISLTCGGLVSCCSERIANHKSPNQICQKQDQLESHRAFSPNPRRSRLISPSCPS